MSNPCFNLREFFLSLWLLCGILFLPKLAANTLEHLPAVDCNTFNGIAYVDGSATGADDGTSWADAFSDLQDALRARVACPGSIDTILVAQGTYYPTPGGTNRDTSFWIPDGVVVLGGFPSGGGALSSRDWNVYETILSGDIDGNNTSSGNSYHVVRTRNVSLSTVVDGFTITGGNANGSGINDSGGGWYNDGSGTGNTSNPTIRNCLFNINSAGNTGGAIYNNGVDGESSPRLINCVLLGNQAGFHGGAVNNNGSTGVSSPTFIDCVLSGNQADSRGGALYNYNSYGVCSPTFINCVLSGNEAGSEGGAIYNNNAFGESSPELTNCVLSGNAAQHGAAIYNFGSFGESSPQLTNCVLSGNAARFYGGAIYTMGNNGESSPTLTNCILYQNDAISAPVFFNDNSTPIVSYSLFDVDFATVNHNGNTIDNGNNKYSTDPRFVFAPPASAAPTTAGDFHLLLTSPAIDMGLNSANTEATDLDGHVRISYGTIDMGAYEYQSIDCNTFNGIAYVDSSATGMNTGTSWMNAYTDLQDALRIRDVCPGSIDTIQVAQGTYFPTPGGTNRDTSFWIPDGVVVVGGFPSGGGALSSRDWNVYETILSGDIDRNNARSGNSYHVVRTKNVSSVTEVDGFTITMGNANGSRAPDNTGGGWYNDGSGAGYSSNPTIRNCAFVSNYAFLGGAIYNQGTGGEISPVFTNCVFSGNSAGYGGAIYNYGGGNGLSSPELINCVLSGNAADANGGAIYNFGLTHESSPTLINCVLSGNLAGQYGGAIYTLGLYGTSSPLLTNCILSLNDASIGPVFFNSNSTPIISHSLFDADSAAVNHQGSVIDNGNNKYSTDPQFVYAPPASLAPIPLGDFHLLPTSPAFNMGDPATDLSGFYMVSGATVDLDGNPRVLNQVIDMGVYEAENCNIATASDTLLTACEEADQMAEFDLDDAQADVNGGTGVSYAYYSDSTAMVNISSSYQATDGTTVYVVVTHEATQCTDTAAITLQVRPAPSVTCVADTTVASCLSQAVIDQAFVDWLGGFTTDCGDCVFSDLSEYAAPDSCGGATTIKYVVWDSCGVAKDSCEASFAVSAPMMVSVNCPTDLVVPGTWPEAEIQSAYEDWLASIETSGGCAITVEHTGPSSPHPAQTCLDAVTEVTWMVSNGCAQTMTCTARFTIQATTGGEERPNCGTFSPSVSEQGEIVVSASDFLTNAASVEYPVVVEIYNQWGGTEHAVELADYCATAVWNICNNLGNELSFSAENEAGGCSEGVIYLPDAPSVVLRSAFQGSSGSPVVTRRSSMTGPHIGPGKINVYCGKIPDPAQHTPTAESGCTGTRYTPRVQPDWVMPVACDEQSDTAKVILRTWEVVDKAGDLHLLTDTIVVFRLPRLTPGAFVNRAEDTTYCELRPVVNEGALQKSYASWKQPMGLHDYEQAYSKLKGVVYQLPLLVVASNTLTAHAGGERVWAAYLDCVILRKADGTEITIGDVIGYRPHGDPQNNDALATNYLEYLEANIDAEQRGYGFLHGIYEWGEDPVSIIGGPVLLEFFPYVLLERGDWILSEEGDYEQVTQDWFYRGNGNAPYWFAGGWPSMEGGGECVSYHDGEKVKEWSCIQIQVPRLTIASGFDAQNCDTICLPTGEHCGIRVENDPVSAWSGGCPQTRGRDAWITQTCWAQTPNSCAIDGAVVCEELSAQTDNADAVVGYSCDSKQVEVHLSRWQTLLDTVGPMIEFCYPTTWDQAGIRDAIRRGVQSEDARNWEADNPTSYSTDHRDCAAEVYVPQIRVIDNCSGMASVKAMVAVPGGVRAVELELTATEQKILGSGDTSVVYTYSHTADPIRVPFGGCDGPLTEIRYEAVDNCWNTSTWRKYIQVVDEVPPTVVVNHAVKATIQNAMSWIGAETLDEGSWDNCSVDLRLARRTDWTAGVELCQHTGANAPYTNWVDLLADLGVDRDQVMRAVDGGVVGRDQFDGAYEVEDLANFLNEGEVEAYYMDQIRWLWEDGAQCGQKVVHGWLFAMARYISEHCSEVDAHGNGLNTRELEYIFDHLMGQPGYGAELAYLGGGWSQSVVVGCADACGAEGGVDVELVVFDGCCNWSKGWTKVDVEDRSRPEIVQKLEDITISCEAYNLFYKDIVEQATGNDNGVQPPLKLQQAGAYAALDSAFGGYVYGGQPTDGNVLPDSVLRYSYSTVVCAERSVTEKVADTLHDGTIRWVTQVRKETYLDTIMKLGANGVVKGGCFGSAYAKASAGSPISAFAEASADKFAKASAGEQRVWLDLDECGYGTITRRFFIGSGCGDHATDQVVEQVIHIKPSCAIRLSMMDLPADVGSKEEALCVPNEEAVYNLPVSLTGNGELWPSLAGAICPAVAIGYEDQVSRVNGTGGMYKVRRTWIFMDWCDRDRPLEYVQEIVVRVDPACNNPEVGARVPDIADGVRVVTRTYEEGYRLYQNHPNPFEGYTVIGFDLPVATEARLTIYDVTGKVLKTIQGDYPKGYHEELIAPGELLMNGVMYYQLRTDKYTATRRMVKVRR